MHPEPVLKSNDIETGAPARVGDILGYARVSTHDQHPDAQRDRLMEAGALRVFTDIISGKRFDRPALAELIDHARPGDRLCIIRLDRLGAHSGSCSKPSTTSRPAASTCSASRSASTPRPRPANSCSTSSAPSRTSNAGSSPRGPATASPRPGNAGAHRVDRHSTRTQFPPRRNSSRLDCPPLEPQNSSALAGQRLTESQKRSGDVETEGLRALRVILPEPLAKSVFGRVFA